MEVQDHTDPNVGEQKSFPIRILHIGEYLIIGFVAGILENTINLIRPYEIHVEAKGLSVTGYYLEPYLNQLADIDENSLSPVPFMLNSVMSVTVPAKHVIENYTHIVQMRAFLSRNEEGEVRIKERHYNGSKLLN